MAPPTGTTWDDTLKYKFLLEIIARTSPTVPSQVLVDIAEKWGEPHTKGSLAIKLYRMKEQYAKTEGSDVGARGGGPKAKPVSKRKAHEDESGDGKKAPKAKKAKKDEKVKSEDDETT